MHLTWEQFALPLPRFAFGAAGEVVKDRVFAPKGQRVWALTGVIGNLAYTDAANTFTARQTITSGAAAAGTGTITSTNNDETITGTGTLFLSEVAVGDVITFSGASFVVHTVTNNTSLKIASLAAITASGQSFTVSKANFLAESAAGIDVLKANAGGGIQADGPLTVFWNVLSGRTRGVTFSDFASDGRMRLHHTDNQVAYIQFGHANSTIELAGVSFVGNVYLETPWLAGTNNSSNDVSVVAARSGTGASQTVTLYTQRYAVNNDQPVLAFVGNGFEFWTKGAAWNSQGVTRTLSMAATGGWTVAAAGASEQPLIVAGVASQSAVLVQLRGESSTTAGRPQADLDTAWVDSTDATRKARFVLNAWDTAAREVLRGEASGSAAKVGFLGASAALQQTGDIGTALVTFGLMSGTPTFAEANVTFTNITTGDVSITKHGYAPKAPNDATKYLDGTGAYSVPAGGMTIGAAVSGGTANYALYVGAGAVLAQHTGFQYNGAGKLTVTDGVNVAVLGGGTYAVQASTGHSAASGTSGNTFFWKNATTAPTPQTLLTLPLNVYGQGTITDLLGDPDAWLLVSINGTDYKIPAYLP